MTLRHPSARRNLLPKRFRLCYLAPLVNLLALTDSDRIALSMLVIMTLALTVVAMLAFSIYRSGKRPITSEDDLLDSLDQERRKPKNPAKPPAPHSEKDASSQPWEREADWWKSGDS